MNRVAHQALIDDRRERWTHRYAQSIRWTNPQASLLECTEPIVVFWGANKIGKTWIMAWDALSFLRGEHPHDQTHRPPVEVAIIGESYAQMQALLQALWRCVDKRDFASVLRLSGGQIKGQKYPVYDVISGPGAGGRLHLRTYSEGAHRLAGPAYHRVVTDEPMDEEVYNELWPRLMSTGGHMRIGFTPTMGTYEDLRYLWRLTDDGFIREIQVPLSLDAVTPRGGLVEAPWKSEADLELFEAGLSPIHRDMRMGRSREPQQVDRVLEGWGEHLHTFDVDPPSGKPPPGPGCWIGVGIDHGAKAGRQRAVVVAGRPEGRYYRIWILAEAYQETRSSDEDDAKNIMEALASAGLTLADVDMWRGDRDHPGDKHGGHKSNRRLIRAFAAVLGINIRDLPAPLRKMRSPSKWEGSVWDGIDIMNQLMLHDPPLLRVHPRVVKLCEDMAAWRGLPTAPEKDGIDAARYIIYDLTEGRARLGSGTGGATK